MRWSDLSRNRCRGADGGRGDAVVVWTRSGRSGVETSWCSTTFGGIEGEGIGRLGTISGASGKVTLRTMGYVQQDTHILNKQIAHGLSSAVARSPSKAPHILLQTSQNQE